MGFLREQPKGAVLPVDSRRAETIEGRGQALGAYGSHHRAVLCCQSGTAEMRSLRRFLRRLVSWTTTRQDEERLREEIEEHLARQTAENIRAGLSPTEARRQAALKFGSTEATKERYREERGFPSLERLIQDARYAL